MANKKEQRWETLRLDSLQKPLTAKELAELMKEIQADEAAGKLENAHGTPEQMAEYRKILEEKAKATAKAPEKVGDRGMER